MLTKVEVQNMQGDVLSLPMQDGVEGYVIQDITGLDPVPANIVSSSFADVDGEQYQASRREKRNIVMTLGLEASLSRGGTVKDLRSNLYRFLMPKSEIKMRFFDNDGSYVDIGGRVEDLKSPLFAKEPEATASIMSLQPDFYVPEPVIVSANTVSNSSEFIIDYDGTVDTGFILRIKPNREMAGITVTQRLNGGTVRTLEFTAPLSSGDVLAISTISGAKGATLTRNGIEDPHLYHITPQSSWLTLMQGQNYIRVASEGSPVPYTIEYTVKIGGL